MALGKQQVADIVGSVQASPDLRLPARMTQTQASEADRIAYLRALLEHNPGVFLERHRVHLTSAQRAYFEPLRSDYEVDFYLRLLEDETGAGASSSTGTSSVTKNRRLAKLNRLDKEGFFEEEALRKRAPLLHHQYIGRYIKPMEPTTTSGAALHDRLIEEQEEAELRSTMAQQESREAAAGEAFLSTLSESESEDEGDGAQPSVAAKPGHSEASPISAEEMEQNRQDLQTIMRARFLDGGDGGAEADGDATLDADWVREETQDAEDRYFDAQPSE